MLAGCTIVSPNYLAFARTLAASWHRHHPGDLFFVLVVADLRRDYALPSAEPFTVVPVSALGIANLRAEAMKYDILELNTNVKPAFLQYLFAEYPEMEQLVYLDPDICVYAPLTPVTELLGGGAAAVLTPHLTSPIEDAKSPSEQELLYNGTYNLGFVAFRRCAEADAMLAWWSRRCLDLGFSEGRTGLFVDQKWMNLLPGLFANVAILRDAGCNMAYWNLHERTLAGAGGGWRVRGGDMAEVPLRFFHFSGVALDEPGVVSRNTNRFSMAERPDLQPLFAAYVAEVKGRRNAATDGIAYGYDRFSDGTAVTRLARRIFAANLPEFAGEEDPFDARGAFAQFCRRERLVAGAAAPTKQTWREFDPRDRRVEWVHRLLRTALRVLGPNRYELLMRYLSYIAVLRHQGVFLRPGARTPVTEVAGAAEPEPTMAQPGPSG